MTLPLSSGAGWCLFWQDVASTDEQRDLAQWRGHGSIVLLPGTWHFVTLPQKINAVKHPQMWALYVVTIYHWKREQGVHFCLNYICENPNKKADFRGIIPVPFCNMKEDLAPAVMHMHEKEASWMKESKLSLKMVLLLQTLWKKREKSSRHWAKNKINVCFLFLWTWRLSHFSVRWFVIIQERKLQIFFSFKEKSSTFKKWLQHSMSENHICADN